MSKRLHEKVQKKLDVPVSLAMRYGSLSIKKGLEELTSKGVDDVIVLPLYPHYAMSSYETVVENVKSECKEWFSGLKLSFIPPFYDDEMYINELVKNIKKNLKGIDYDHILFSYHGIPESHLKISDETNKHCLKVKDCCNVNSYVHKKCYRHQVFITTELIVKKLGIDHNKYSNAFQSRLVIITPAFVTDCLETLEEIAMEGKEEFLEAGGEFYHYIPCLNDGNGWANVISNWTNRML